MADLYRRPKVPTLGRTAYLPTDQSGDDSGGLSGLASGCELYVPTLEPGDEQSIYFRALALVPRANRRHWFDHDGDAPITNEFIAREAIRIYKIRQFQAAGVSPAHHALNHRAILSIAWPIVLSNLSTPLLGLIDTGIVGQLPDPAYIGAVALGAMIFNFVYWAFGFLRMGTTGLTAQAIGAGDQDEVRLALMRALLIAGLCGLVLILCQPLVSWTAFSLVNASLEVESGAADYFRIRIWSAPFSLANFALLGWFIGCQRSKLALLMQCFLNGLNAALDAIFVIQFGWGIAGIAAGTLIAEISAAALGTSLAIRQFRQAQNPLNFGRLLDWPALRRAFLVNREIMLRTLCLLSAFSFFTAKSAEFGDVLLAVNSILLHFVSFTAYFLDGFAFAAEAFVGQAIGQVSRTRLLRSIRLSTAWSAGCAFMLASLLFLLGPFAIDCLSTSPPVRTEGRNYLPWVVLLPTLSFWCWQLDGIFIGATHSHEMQKTAVWSLASFLIFYAVLCDYGNHGLWLSLLLFNVMRGIFLGLYLPALVRSVPQIKTKL